MMNQIQKIKELWGSSPFSQSKCDFLLNGDSERPT